MRKNKFLEGRIHIGLFALALLFTTFFFSCKSTPKMNDVAALDVLDGNSGFFVYIPAKDHQKFVTTAVTALIDGISEKDASLVASRTEELAISVGGNKMINFQVAAKGSYPQFAVKKAFTEDRGWKKEVYAIDGINYDVYKGKGLVKSNVEVSIPANMALIGTGIEDNLIRYNFLALDSISDGKKTAPDSWDQSVYDYLLSGKNGEIMFFAKNPALALKAFLGKGMNLGMKTVSGCLHESKDNKFALEIIIELSDSRTMKAALSIVKLAIFPVAAKISMKDSSHILIQDLSLEYKDLISMLNSMK